MILNKWYEEHVRLGGSPVILDTTMGRYLVVKGDTPRTLKCNLRELARELNRAADQIEMDEVQ